MKTVSILKRDTNKDLDGLSNLNKLVEELFIENNFECNSVFKYIEKTEVDDLGFFSDIYFINGGRYVLKRLNSNRYNYRLSEKLSSFVKKLYKKDVVEITSNSDKEIMKINLPHKTKLRIFKKFIHKTIENIKESVINNETNIIRDLGILNYIVMLLLSKSYRDNECINFLDVYGFKKCFLDITLNLENCMVNYIFDDFLLYERVDGNIDSYILDIFKNNEIKNLPRLFEGIIIQVIFSIIFYQTKFKMMHTDLHLENILYSIVTKKTKYNDKYLNNCDYYYYVVNGKKYSFSKTDIIIKISDFDTVKFKYNQVYESFYHKIKIEKPMNNYNLNDYIYFMNLMDTFFNIKDYYKNYFDTGKELFYKFVLPYLLLDYVNHSDADYKKDQEYISKIINNIFEKFSIEKIDYDDIYDKDFKDLNMVDVLNTLYHKFDYGYEPKENEEGVCLGEI